MKGDKISNPIITVTCLNCNERVSVSQWNRHKTEVHMKGISLFSLLKETETVSDGLNVMTCLKYVFKKV